jgi:hypothetical protein
MASVDQFYTLQSIGTLGGASGAVLVVSKLVGRFTPLHAAPVAAIFSLLVAIAGASQTGTSFSFSGIIVIIVNTALLFSTATGLNETIAAGAREKPTGIAGQHGRPLRPKKFLSSWFSEP